MDPEYARSSSGQACGWFDINKREPRIPWIWVGHVIFIKMQMKNSFFE